MLYPTIFCSFAEKTFMKIVVAIDSMKGCLSSLEASEAFAAGFAAASPEADITVIPVADGGEGTAAAIAYARQNLERRICIVTGPMGKPVEACWWMDYRSRTAFMDMASASGLTLVPENERNPLITTSAGTGELILDAIKAGASEIVVGMGGSATVDGGKGACEALADADTCRVTIRLACDVTAPFTGENGAAHVFGPQKGASPEDVEILERRLENIRREIIEKYGLDLNEVPGSGAAGGCAGALMTFAGAKIENGAALVLDAAGFDKIISDADLIITGEGSADSQTLMGKLPYEILRRGAQRRIPVWLVAGQIKDSEALLEAGFSRIIDINSQQNEIFSHTRGMNPLKSEVAKARLRSAPLLALSHS